VRAGNRAAILGEIFVNSIKCAHCFELMG